MDLKLAIVDFCRPGGSQVKMLEDGRLLDARFSALVLGKVRILPGQLVAVDMAPAVPEIAWRWYRASVVEVNGIVVTVQDRERQLNAVITAGMQETLTAGDEVWITGMQGAWEIHDRVLEGKAAHPERITRQAVPRIIDLLAAAHAA